MIHCRCDICSTTLTSRQQLRDHKQTVHGVSYPVGTPSTPSAPPSLSTLSTAMSTPTRPIKTRYITLIGICHGLVNFSVVQSPSMSIPSHTNASMSTMDLSSLPPESSSSSSIDHTIPSIPSIPSLNIIPDLMVNLPYPFPFSHIFFPVWSSLCECSERNEGIEWNSSSESH